MPTAFSENENRRYPLLRNRSLQRTTAIPEIKPIAILPVSPIHRLSIASFSASAAQMRTAEIPIRFNQWEPMRASRLLLSSPSTLRNEGDKGLAIFEDSPAGIASATTEGCCWAGVLSDGGAGVDSRASVAELGAVAMRR